MSRAALEASRALWRAREVRWYREWRRLVKKGSSITPGTKRYNAHAKWEEAHKNRVRRDRQIRELVVQHVDTAGLRFLIDQEGKRNRPYNDSLGYATTGVGHLIAKRSVSSLTPAQVRRWTLTDAEVMTLLAHDLASFEKAVRGVLKGTRWQGDQGMFNACVSLAFNIGVGGFTSSTLARRLRAGATEHEIAEGFRMWHNPPELAPRREREIKLFA